MTLLLDTCAILWLAADPDQLSDGAKQAIRSHSSRLCVSAISAFEIALKHRKKKLDLGMEPAIWWHRAVAHHGLVVIPVTDDIALQSNSLPPLHNDPCDRILVATAIEMNAAIVTCDDLIRQYAANVVW